MSFLAVLLSLIVGAATRVLWDSFTHKHGWLASEMPLLKAPLMVLFGHHLRLHHVLWYLSSIGGAAFIAHAWLRWRERSLGRPSFGLGAGGHVPVAGYARGAHCGGASPAACARRKHRRGHPAGNPVGLAPCPLPSQERRGDRPPSGLT